MKEVCLPFTNMKDNEMAEVEVKLSDSGRVWKYRVESFKIDSGQENELKENKIEKLRHKIKTYDQNWELIQIYNSDEESGYVQLLYRQKN